MRLEKRYVFISEALSSKNKAKEVERRKKRLKWETYVNQDMEACSFGLEKEL